jgi:hypothetical protein
MAQLCVAALGDGGVDRLRIHLAATLQHHWILQGKEGVLEVDAVVVEAAAGTAAARASVYQGLGPWGGKPPIEALAFGAIQGHQGPLAA